MKKLLTAAALLALLSAIMSAPAHAQLVALFPTGSSIAANGTYGVLGAATSGSTNWVDCTAYHCDARIMAVGAAGQSDFEFECQIQTDDADETPYQCVLPFTIPSAASGIDLAHGAYITLADAAFYRLKMTNYASGNWKVWIRKTTLR